jgi:HEAT repeat protein
MTDPDKQIRSDATEQMAAYPPNRVAPLLRRVAWESTSQWTQREAAETMGDLPAAIALPLLDEIVAGHPDDMVAMQAVEVISTFPDSLSVPRLRKLLETSTRTVVRREALDQLDDHRSWRDEGKPDPDPNPNPPDNEDPDPNDSAEIGGESERVPVGPETESLARSNAARFANGGDGAAVRRLAKGLDHQPMHVADLVRDRSVWALAQMDRAKLVGPLVVALRDPDWRVRAYAAWALGVAGDPRATAAIRQALSDPHWRVRMHAASALESLGTL